MSRTIMLDVPESLFDLVADAARASGMAPADWIVHRLEPPSSSGVMASPSSEDGNHSSDEDPFRKLFGSVDLGDPHSADNDRIDADFAKEYGRGFGLRPWERRSPDRLTDASGRSGDRRSQGASTVDQSPHAIRP